MENQRKKIVAGNWKMNLTFQEAKQLLSKIHTAILNEKKEILIFPNSLYQIGRAHV